MTESDDEAIATGELKVIPKLKKGKQSKEKTSFSEAISQILQKPIKKGHEANPIFSNFKKPFKKIKKEMDEKKKVQEKKSEQLNFIKKFHVKPDFQKDRPFENKLKRVAIKGVVKLYNQIKAYQSKQQEA